MRKISAVAVRELAASAVSPSAWVFLVIFLVMSAFTAFIGSGLFSSGQADLTPFFDRMPWLFLLLIPALAMPMWSEERRLGVFELSMSFPASVFDLVFGKFLAGLILLCTALIMTLPIPLTAVILGKPDLGAILCGYAGALLLGSVYLSMSLFCSALSKSQTASFLLSLLLCSIFVFLGWPQLTALAERWIPAGLLTAISSCAFIPNYQAFQKGVIDTSELIYSLTLSGLFTALTCFSLRFAASGSGSPFAPGAFSDRGFLRALALLFGKSIYAVILTIGLNIICSEWRFRFDVSSDKAYSISGTLRKLAAAQKTPVTLRFYASVSHPSMLPSVRKYAERVNWLLREFAAASGGKIKFVFIDPDPDSADADAAVMDGVKAMTDKMGDRLFLGLSAGSAEVTAAVPMLSPANESMLEYEIARIVRNVSRQSKKKLGIMSAFPVLGTQWSGAGFSRQRAEQKPVPPWYSMIELARDYELKSLPLDILEIPDGLDAVLVIHPAGITKRGLYALDQYLMRGGNLGVFVDPRSFYAVLKTRTDYSMSDKVESDLSPLLSAMGVRYTPSMVAADMTTAYRKTLPDRLITNPMVLNLTPDQISRKDPITAGLNSISLFFSGYFEFFPVPGLKTEILLHTSRRAQPVNALLAGRNELVLRNFKSADREFALSAVISGKFYSAFPSGVRENSKSFIYKHLRRAEKPGEVILFADSDMIFNDVCIQRGTDSFGEQVIVRSNDNITLLQNAADRLTGGLGLYDIRGRIPMSRPLTRINDLKAAAELKYKNRIMALEKDFSESMMRLQYYRKKASAEGPNGPDAVRCKAEIRRITIKTAAARRELKELRSNLKNELNAMENRIKIINVILVPAAVAVIGILWALFRHAMARRKQK